jgi:hypothetical protein
MVGASTAGGDWSCNGFTSSSAGAAADSVGMGFGNAGRGVVVAVLQAATTIKTADKITLILIVIGQKIPLSLGGCCSQNIIPAC